MNEFDTTPTLEQLRIEERAERERRLDHDTRQIERLAQALDRRASA